MTQSDFHIRDDCRLCYGPLWKVLDLPPTALANEYPEKPTSQEIFPLFLARCLDCGHVQLPVVVDPERLFREYAYQSGTSPAFVEHLREFATYNRAGLSGSIHYPPLVVDIASNDGTLLDQFSPNYYRRLGVDPARNLAEKARAKGIETITEFFTPTLAREIVAKHGKAHLVTALNVFAHVDDLNRFAAGVAELLHDDGVFVFECGYLPDVIERGLYRVIYSEHLSYHSLGPLMPFFAKHGLRLRHAERVDTQGGSIRCFVRKQPDAQISPASDELLQMILAETPASLNVARLATRIHEDKIVLRATLLDLKAQGKTVCGYGAPAQLTTLCAALGITAQDIDFIVDDNPLKQGRFTPGRHIPILPPEALYERKPDACIIFSANFAEDIMKRHADFKGDWVTL